MDVNFFGPLTLIRTLLPRMRRNPRGGTVVNISSTAASIGFPGTSMYSASKMALEGTALITDCSEANNCSALVGLSESLSRESEPFGIRVLIVVPGSFRTNFQASMRVPADGLSEVYVRGAVGRVLRAVKEQDGNQPGDPNKAAKSLFDLVTESTRLRNEPRVLRIP